MAPAPLTLTQRLGALALLAYAVTVTVSGLAWPLGDSARSLWPFNRQWFMFHTEGGRFYHLRVDALRDDGTREEADLSRWFHWPASEATLRYDEIARTPESVRALARYLCAKNPRWVAVSVVDTDWPLRPGERVPFDAVPLRERHTTDHLRGERCPRGR